MAAAAKLKKVPDLIRRGIDALPQDGKGNTLSVAIPSSGGKTVTQTRSK